MHDTRNLEDDKRRFKEMNCLRKVEEALYNSKEAVLINLVKRKSVVTV